MKLIKTEALKIRQMKVPVITGIYDPLSRRRNGIIASQAPAVVSGRDLDLSALGSPRLCLVPAVEYVRLIEVPCVYLYSPDRIIVSLPVLSPGEYLPAVRISGKGEEDAVYIFPVTWVVLPER